LKPPSRRKLNLGKVEPSVFSLNAYSGADGRRQHRLSYPVTIEKGGRAGIEG
jgi:hypothetical protein